MKDLMKKSYRYFGLVIVIQIKKMYICVSPES